MEEKQDSEKLIGKLIQKRKAENEAFKKLLRAIENKSQESSQSPAPKQKQ